MHTTHTRHPSPTTHHPQQPVNGAEEVVSIVQQVAAGTYNFTQADAQAGATRLRDTVVWGYVMQR